MKYPVMQKILLLVSLVLGGAVARGASADAPARPNIIYILADDLGYGDLGCYGQRELATPNIDRLAAEGLRFTQHYAGNAMCTPSRSSLMTGLHSGHVRHRNNKRFVDSYGFRPEDVTLAEVMKEAGYATAICGKWHLGDRADTKDTAHFHGFDFAYCTGYPYPERGWEHWPSHVFINARQTPIPGNGGGNHAHYMDDLYTEAALGFMREHRAQPFVVYLAFQGVHAPMDGRLSPRYANRDWPEPEKIFASMLERVDENVGRVVATLRELGLERNTVIFFAGDNGPHNEGGHRSDFFHSAGPWRGAKFELYEGGIRTPLIVRWPGVVAAGTRTDAICTMWDMLPTFAEIGGAPVPGKTDGISALPILRGHPPRNTRYLYWENPDSNGSQGVRWENWKAIRRGVGADANAPFELYDLQADPTESRSVAREHADVLERIRAIVAEAHVPSGQCPLYPEEKARAGQ